MTWHGQINRTIWEIDHLLSEKPGNQRLQRELLRTFFLQRYEYDRSNHVPRDDRSFLFMQEDRAPATLLLHGAHGTPAEMRDLGNFLYSKGFTVFCPRLSRYDMKNRRVTWESWVTAAESALTATLKYSDRTVVVGLSLGGTVSMLLERMHPVKGVVLLAPALYLRFGFKGAMYSVLRRLVPSLYYRVAGWNGEAVKAMDHIRRTTPERIETPALVIQARDDHILSPKGIKFLERRVANENSEVSLLEEGSHALTRGTAKEEVFERLFQFVRRIRLTSDRPSGGRPPGRPTDRPGQRSGDGSRDGQPRRRRRGSRGGRGRNRGGDRSTRPGGDSGDRGGRRPSDGRGRTGGDRPADRSSERTGGDRHRRDD